MLSKLAIALRRVFLKQSISVVEAGVKEAGAFTIHQHGFIFNPLDKAFVDEPYPIFSYLRQQEPLHRSLSGAWVLSRYSDVKDALVDTRMSNSPSAYALVNKRNHEKYVCAQVANNILPFIDPPAHTSQRQAVNRAFHQCLRNKTLDYPLIAREILKSIMREKPNGFDLLADFATPYSLRVFTCLLGIDSSHEKALEGWSESFFYLFTMIPSEKIRIKLDEDLLAFRAFLNAELDKKAKEPVKGNDLLSTMLDVQQDDKGLNRDQIIDNCMLLFADGIENVDKAITAAVALLCQHPEQFETLKRQPELLPSAVDECLRYESPAQFVARVAAEDIHLYQKTIKKNDAVLLLLASANHDEQQFEQADRFNIERTENAHLSFGKSRHICIGAALVKQEMEAALSVLFELMPDIALQDESLEWQERLGHRWLRRLNIQY